MQQVESNFHIDFLINTSGNSYSSYNTASVQFMSMCLRFCIGRGKDGPQQGLVHTDSCSDWAEEWVEDRT